MIYLLWLAVLLSPYWLGPIVVWLTQKPSARPVFEPFDPARHAVPEDVKAALRQTCEALATEGFRVVADLFQTGHVKHVSVRVALLAHPAKSYVELPTRFRDGRSVSVNNSPRLGAFAPRAPRTVVQFLDVRDPARLYRIKRAFPGATLPGRGGDPVRASGGSGPL